MKYNSLLIWVGFFLTTLLLYAATIQSGFTTDVTGGIERLSTRPLKDIFISFGFPALNQLSVALFYIQYQLFGTNGWGWYVVYAGLHSWNAYLLFCVFQKLFQENKIPASTSIAFFGALLFLINPYQSEVVVWRACQNYLLSTCFILSSLWYALSYFKDGRNLWLVHLFFVLALFTFEYGLITPILLTALWMVGMFFKNNFYSWRKNIGQIVVPQLLAIGGYFVLNKWVFGNWVGHYGASVHWNFPIKTMIATGIKFLAKYLFFVRFYEHPNKEFIFQWIDEHTFLLFAIILIAFFLIGWIGYQKKPVYLIGLLCLVLFAIAILPVSNLYFYYLQYLINDRHGYLASAFLLMGLSICFFQFPKILRIGCLVMYASFSIFFLTQINQHWKTSTTIFNNLMHDFKWYDSPKVVLLNVPENYKGLYLFRIIGEGSGFEDALEYVNGNTYHGEMIEVVQYNMETPTDGVQVERLSDTMLKVTFNQWGNWFWRNGVGAGNGYENEYYSVQFKGQYYEITTKRNLEDAVFLYQDGMAWKEFEF